MEATKYHIATATGDTFFLLNVVIEGFDYKRRKTGQISWVLLSPNFCACVCGQAGRRKPLTHLFFYEICLSVNRSGQEGLN